MMMRLYCPKKNIFVDPTDRNVLIWYQQHRKDPTIGLLQTHMLYEETPELTGGKYWDEEKREIRYANKRKAKVSGRHQLYPVPWSGLYDRNNRPIFHGDLLGDGDRPHRVCDAQLNSNVRFLVADVGVHWNLPTTDYTKDMAIVDSAILNPHLVGDSIRNLFVYPKAEEL